MNVIIIITGVFILLVVGYLVLSGSGSGSESPTNTSTSSTSIKVYTRLTPGYYQPRVSGIASSSGTLVTSSE